MIEHSGRKTENKKRGLFTQIRDFFLKPSTRYGLGILLLFGIGIGVAGWNGMMAVVESSSSTEFCSSCHEMEAFVFPGFEQSTHQNNRSGVSAECRDCHVPKPLFAKMQTKIRASLVEVPGHLTGKIATEEKFREHQLELAERVWARMKANNSRECRNCHSYEVMSSELQSRTARRRHSQEYREATDRTCIDCHKGVVHSLPPDR